MSTIQAFVMDHQRAVFIAATLGYLVIICACIAIGDRVRGYK